MSGKDGNETSCTDGLAQQWSDFLGFMYDSSTKTVMGRNGKSWAKILIFYLFYYGALAGLFSLSLMIVQNTLDDYTPTYQTRLQTPGVGVQPKIPSNIEQSGSIIYTVPEPGTDWAKNVGYSRLVNQITSFLKPYNIANQTVENDYRTCQATGPMQLGQEFGPGEKAISCNFDKSQLGPCANAPYGYDVGQPCLYIKLNRSSDDRMKLNQGDWKNNAYFPTHMGLPFVYYPYHGLRRQPSYLNPLVAVQLRNVTRNQKIDVACKVYAKNIVDNKDMGEGYFRFDVQIGDY